MFLQDLNEINIWEKWSWRAEREGGRILLELHMSHTVIYVKPLAPSNGVFL